MKKAILQRPNDYEAHIQYISALMAENKLSAAETASKRAIKKFPDIIQISVLRAEILAKMERFYPARHLLQKLILRKPDLAVAYVMLGLIDCEQHLDQDAISKFETAMEIDPKNYQASFFAASLYLKMLDYGNAERALKQTLTAHPGHIEALKSIGELMVKTNRYEEAVGFLRQILAHSNIDVESAAYLIQAEVIAKNSKIGVVTAKKLIAIFPESIEVLEAHIFALIRDGQFEKAIKQCDQLINCHIPAGSMAVF